VPNHEEPCEQTEELSSCVIALNRSNSNIECFKALVLAFRRDNRTLWATIKGMFPEVKEGEDWTYDNENGILIKEEDSKEGDKNDQTGN